MRRILISGPPGSGKSTTAAILNRDFQLQWINVGDVLHERLTSEGVLCSSRSEIGPRFLAQHPQKEIFNVVRTTIPEHGGCSIDGVRLALTCKQFKEWDSSVEIWVLEIPLVLEMARLHNKLATEHPKRSITQEELEQSRIYNTEQPQILSLADTVIRNDGSLDELATKVRKAFKRSAVQFARF